MHALNMQYILVCEMIQNIKVTAKFYFLTSHSLFPFPSKPHKGLDKS